MEKALSNVEYRSIIERAHKAGQGHIFRFWEKLSEQGRKKLLNQVKGIDFDLLGKLAKEHIFTPHERTFQGEIEPINTIPVPRTAEGKKRALKAKEAGETALRQGKVAALTVAGGQATRLGYEGPKGKFPIGPISGKSIFQLYAEKLRAVRLRYSTIIPWYIMTSEANDQETKDFFQQNDYFGLAKADVFFFTQGMMPALDENGRLFLDAKAHIFTSPNGHGGSLSALMESGALKDMRTRGIEEIFYFQVDNILIKICDPVFIGYHIQEGAEMSAKVMAKRDPYEKLGIIGRINGRLGVIEYSDLSRKDMEARNPDGSLKYNAGSIALHLLKVDFVERENKGGLRLPYHAAHKKIPYLDEKGGLIKPDRPNGYKFETFVFDALQDAERAVIMEVERAEEFSVVKNARGQDSPETAQRELVNFFGRWLEKAGIRIPRDSEGNVQGKIEISPLYALDEEELVNKIANKGLAFDGELYLG